MCASTGNFILSKFHATRTAFDVNHSDAVKWICFVYVTL